MPDILDRIIERRREDYARFGPTFGVELPPSRARAVVPFLSESGTILEIKRASPSKGDIAPWLDPVKLAGQYEEAGTKNISVLTEMRFFKGGLGDLLSASSAFPRVSFLRKDFLLYEEEIEISWRAGADAVLLIARILDQGLLLKMAAKARSLGMTAFIEVREQADIAKLAAAAKAGPVLAGVNSRDLATFHIDPLVPAILRSSLPCRTVFESGASTPGACRFARRIGFDGILIGEAAARDPANAGSLVKGFLDARPDWVGHFWREIGRRVSSRPRDPQTGKARPLVKICGITNAEDASLAAGLGADMLGFVFAKSARAATSAAVREIAALFAARSGAAGSAADAGRLGEAIRPGDAGSHAPSARPLFVAVITDPSSSEAKEAFALAVEGVIDAIQCHGGDAVVLDAVDAAGGSYGIGRFAAVGLGSEEDLAEAEKLVRSGEPRVLVDARVAGSSGGTGTRISSDLVRRAAGLSSLWLAGGLNPSNVRECIEEFSPELIDASSGLESAPGKKDPELLKSFFREIAS